ncbi:hypothetical protein NEOLEDRAFT_380898 [Neolentinus lepideus HHB14362 ss-1]|uniref:Uncharacterized protein n=1 Tax=Neolentinus lepideus HHB14362 ss-1 TaxID=1314782 RepID=A0A165SCN4_9AGAM|nr:hypothetical protein NEOLEDRAFT_380898 [Neolentinus lepideus HHB14362 ss-1]
MSRFWRNFWLTCRLWFEQIRSASFALGTKLKYYIISLLPTRVSRTLPSVSCASLPLPSTMPPNAEVAIPGWSRIQKFTAVKIRFKYSPTITTGSGSNDVENMSAATSTSTSSSVFGRLSRILPDRPCLTFLRKESTTKSAPRPLRLVNGPRITGRSVKRVTWPSHPGGTGNRAQLAHRLSLPDLEQLKSVNWEQQSLARKRKAGVAFYRNGRGFDLPTPPTSPRLSDYAGPTGLANNVVFTTDEDAAPGMADAPGLAVSVVPLFSPLRSNDKTICESPSGDNSQLIALYADLPAINEDVGPMPAAVSAVENTLPTPPASPHVCSISPSIESVVQVVPRSTPINPRLSVPKLKKLKKRPSSLLVIIEDEEPTPAPIIISEELALAPVTDSMQSINPAAIVAEGSALTSVVTAEDLIPVVAAVGQEAHDMKRVRRQRTIHAKITAFTATVTPKVCSTSSSKAGGKKPTVSKAIPDSGSVSVKKNVATKASYSLYKTEEKKSATPHPASGPAKQASSSKSATLHSRTAARASTNTRPSSSTTAEQKHLVSKQRIVPGATSRKVNLAGQKRSSGKENFVGWR